MNDILTVSQVAEYLRLDTTVSPLEETALLQGFVDAATDYCENYLNRTIVQKQLKLTLYKFKPIIYLPFGDVSSVDTIQYIDNNGNTQQVTSYILSENHLTPAYNEVWPNTRRQLGSVTILYTAGYDLSSSPPDKVPDAIIQAMYLLIGDMYDNRTAQTVKDNFNINPAVFNLLTPYRIDMGI